VADGSRVVVDGTTLSCVDVVRVARRSASVDLDVAAVERARQAYEFAAATGATRAVYGRTTGVGANRHAVIAAVRALRMAGTEPEGAALGRAYRHVTGRLPMVAEDHPLSDELAQARTLVDDLARF
jgi:histidine ammonia-lyase